MMRVSKKLWGERLRCRAGEIGGRKSRQPNTLTKLTALRAGLVFSLGALTLAGCTSQGGDPTESSSTPVATETTPSSGESIDTSTPSAEPTANQSPSDLPTPTETISAFDMKDYIEMPSDEFLRLPKFAEEGRQSQMEFVNWAWGNGGGSCDYDRCVYLNAYNPDNDKAFDWDMSPTVHSANKDDTGQEIMDQVFGFQMAMAGRQQTGRYQFDTQHAQDMLAGVFTDTGDDKQTDEYYNYLMNLYAEPREAEVFIGTPNETVLSESEYAQFDGYNGATYGGKSVELENATVWFALVDNGDYGQVWMIAKTVSKDGVGGFTSN